MQIVRIDDDLRIAGEHRSWTVQERNKAGVWIVVKHFEKFHHAFKYVIGEPNDHRKD
jgi:hypothetical protein